MWGVGGRGTPWHRPARAKVSSSVLTQLVERRHAVIVGSLDGNDSRPGTWFVHIPDEVPPKSEWKKDTDDA